MLKDLITNKSKLHICTESVRNQRRNLYPQYIQWNRYNQVYNFLKETHGSRYYLFHLT